MPIVQNDLETRLTCADIARECCCHPSAVSRWIQKGAVLSTGEHVKLQAIRTPGGWRVWRSDLDQFLEVLTADRLRPDAPTESKPTPKSAHRAKLNAELARNGF